MASQNKSFTVRNIKFDVTTTRGSVSQVVVDLINPGDRAAVIKVLRVLPVGSTVTFKGYPSYLITRES